MPVALFEFKNGQVDLAEGVNVSDAVVAFWERLQGVVAQAWAEGPVSREKARVQVLTAYLDRIHPGWREDLAWTMTE